MRLFESLFGGKAENKPIRAEGEVPQVPESAAEAVEEKIRRTEDLEHLKEMVRILGAFREGERKYSAAEINALLEQLYDAHVRGRHEEAQDVLRKIPEVSGLRDAAWKHISQMAFVRGNSSGSNEMTNRQ